MRGDNMDTNLMAGTFTDIKELRKRARRAMRRIRIVQYRRMWAQYKVLLGDRGWDEVD